MIISVILMTTLFYKALILQGEIWCWSLLGLIGLIGQITFLNQNNINLGYRETAHLPLPQANIFLKWELSVTVSLGEG